MDLGKLRTQLIKHEGLKLQVYLDTVGIPTIGVGHNLKAKPLTIDVSHGITTDQAMAILDTDLAFTTSFLTKNCPWWLGLDDCRQRAITDLAFNLMGKLLDFKHMIAAIQVKDWPLASKELLSSTFAAQTGQRAKDLAHQLETGHD